MGSCLITVEQEIEGQAYETVHAAQSELDLIGEDGQPSEAFILELFAGGLPGPTFDNNTDPVSVAYEPGTYGLVGSILAFHRYMQAKLVRLTRLYISDGKKAGGGAPNIFYSLPMDLACRGVGMINDQDPVNVAPANLAQVIDKVPAGFGHRAGRMFLRCSILKSTLMVGGPNGVTLDPDAQTATINRLIAGIASSQIDGFYDTGTDADQAAVYAIANYYPKAMTDADPTKKGQLQGSTGVSSLRFGGLTGRQTNRPSKRR